MKIIYIDFTSGDIYDAKGAPFANQNQLISYLENTEDYEIHYVTDGGTSETPSEWTPYTGFESMSVSSLFAIDNNFISSYEGKNLSAIESGGSVSSISVEVSATERYIPKTGVLVLRNAGGEEQSFAYVSRSAIEKGYAFTLGAAETADYAFEEGATVSVPESLMILAEGDYDAETNAVNYVDDSRKSEGIFGVHFLTMSDKLMENFEFTNTESLQLTAEHAILSNGETIKRFQFRIYINKPIAFQRSADVPESNAMGIASQSWVLSLLRNKFEFQFSADGTTDWHDIQNQETDQYYRQRISVVGADWSDAMYIPRGPAGEDGTPAPELKTQYSVDGSTLWHDEYAEDDAYMRTSSDNGESWSGAIRILGQQGTAGNSAGFGTPTVQIEMLDAGSEATAEVTASGEDTAKEFQFSFGIPQGKQGKSAYQAWLDSGNTGDEQDFFDSLTGAAMRHAFTASDVTSGTLSVSTYGCPVSISDDTGITYPLQFGSFTMDGNNVVINMTANLSAIGKEVTGTWYVNFASGGKETPAGVSITEHTESSLAPVDGAIYRHTIVADETIELETANLTADRCATFELWLTMGDTVVSFSLPDNLVWVSSAPSFGDINTLYALVIRWDGSGFVANMAYSKEVTA